MPVSKVNFRQPHFEMPFGVHVNSQIFKLDDTKRKYLNVETFLHRILKRKKNDKT